MPEIRKTSMLRVGLISDTHSLLRDEALCHLSGSDLIVHAGDAGSPDVLVALERLAPVTTVRGNVDRGQWGLSLPKSAVVEAGEAVIYMLHNIDELDLDPKAAGFDVVVFGHTHVPSLDIKSGVLYVNPGAAGPRRFRLPVSVAFLEIEGRKIQTRFVDLVSGGTFDPLEVS